MLENNPVDDSTPTDAPTDAGAPEAGDPPAAPAKKTAAKRAPAKKATAKRTTTRKTAAKKVAAPEEPLAADVPTAQDPVTDVPADAAPAVKATKRAPAKRTTTRKTAAKKVAAADPQEGTPSIAPDAPAAVAPAAAVENAPSTPAVLFQAPVVTQTPRRRTRKVAAPAPAVEDTPAGPAQPATEPTTVPADGPVETPAAPTVTTTTRRSRRRPAAAPVPETDEAAETETETAPADEPADETAPADEPIAEAATDEATDTDGTDDDIDDADTDTDTDSTEGEGGGRRRRRRGGRRRRKSGDGPSDDSGDEQDSRQGNGRQGGARQSAAKAEPESAGQAGEADQQEDKQSDKDGKQDGRQDGRGRQGGRDADDDQGEGSSRRRRRRRRTGDDGPDGGDDAEQTVTRVRKPRNAEDEITAISGSTRLEAKKQRRRDGREAGRRRAPIVSEAEFLARREAVERVMVIRQRRELTQIAVIEDNVLVEHYVARESQTSIIGNVYLGRVQNVLPSMEAAFIDIGKGRNAVLYAGEVNWSALGHKDGQPRKIESVLSSGQSILVQVTKDPIGHKGARLTSQVSLAGRFLVYVPDGTTSGISRKLPDTERARLKALLKEIVPESAGVIVRTAAEGASEDELTRDVERLKARWEDIEAKVKGSSPQLLYGEPDLTLKVVRDLFTEDFSKLVIEGDDAWDTVEGYVKHVAPDLADRLERYDPAPFNGKDSFAAYRVDEQIAKGLDRKVWLPSGGSLVIDRTEAMTVVDVNTGKFTGSGGNLEETVTKNNLEAAEEMVRQLRLRDIGGIIVIDFIDMVLESNRDLVLRRLVECLGRDRTRHQVAEVTSLGLVQMTRKRIGTGLVEAFSENCSHCQGRGVVIQDTPVEADHSHDDDHRRGSGGGGGGNTGSAGGGTSGGAGGSAGGGGRRSRGGRGRGQDGNEQLGQQGGGGEAPVKPVPSPTYVAAVARPENTPVEVGQPEPATPAPAVDEPVVESQPAATSPVETPPVEAPPVEAPVETPPAEAPATVEGKPKVVTRTRRRTAVVTVPAPQPVETATAEAPAQAPATPLEAPVQAPVVPATEKPKVVTRTRGRGSRS